jgi:protein-disulfide isomerase
MGKKGEDMFRTQWQVYQVESGAARLVCFLVGMVGLLLAAGVTPQAQERSSATTSPVLATVNGVNITEEQLRATIQGKLFDLENQIYTLKQEGLNELIGNYLLEQEAEKRGISVQQLVQEEIENRLSPITDAEIERFYTANKSRINRPLEQVKPQLTQYLQNLNRNQQRNTLLSALRAQATVVTFLQPPRIEVSIGDDPMKGPADAPVTIVEFSDFQCPFCKRVLPTLEQVLTTYAGKIRLVFRDFPIVTIHPHAQRSAEAAHCAREQGKYWEYHDALFAAQEKFAVTKLSEYAQSIGLDIAAFEQCLASNKYTAEIQKDIADGSQIGVTGTPAFFINGRLLSGAQPFEAFQRIIEEELRLAQQK